MADNECAQSLMYYEPRLGRCVDTFAPGWHPPALTVRDLIAVEYVRTILHSPVRKSTAELEKNAYRHADRMMKARGS